MDRHPPPMTLNLKSPLKNSVVGMVEESHFIGSGIAEMGQEYPHIKNRG